ncbi:histidine kinase dimerization/phospho-acceptor domain-containing protein [Deefgea salmonis]|uniref:histidine kinase n=1 Tax=Deefgea salmonis TaxID=2875502 RepID=A0ABS8BHE0_9NEIS|nr:histidine kinase dimerization/phospho-acceptor domain-containing protein [Deefgea salmonis]MCB5195132.1 response regulator [Deefgea salmonis]
MNHFKFRTIFCMVIGVLSLVSILVLSYEFKAQKLLNEFNSPQQQRLIKEARSGNRRFSFLERATDEAIKRPTPAALNTVKATFADFATLIQRYDNGQFYEYSNQNSSFTEHIAPLAQWAKTTQQTLAELNPSQLPALAGSMKQIAPHLRIVVASLDAQYNANLEAKKNTFTSFSRYRLSLIVLLLALMSGFAYFALRTLWRNQQTLAQLKTAEQNAQAANQAKSHFLASISHEMRTPLTTILGYAELAQAQANPNSSNPAYLQHIIQASRHLQTLLGNVLDMSKIEAGHFSLNPNPLDLPALINELNGIFQPMAQTKGLTLQISADSVADNLWLDTGKWRQILINLLSNAIKFSDHGTIGCHISAHALTEQSTTLKAVVTDQGMGISAAEARAVFRPFEQTASGRFKGGTGLGLALSKQYALNMAGDLSFTSQTQLGSIFTCTVQAEIQAFCAQTPAPQNSLQGLCILLVEDQEVNRDLMRQILCLANASVIEACNGQHALTILNQNPHINMLVIDRNMPELDGIATLETLRQRGNFLPALMVSAGLRPSEAEIQRIGLNGWLGKPFSAKDLIQAIASITQSLSASFIETRHEPAPVHAALAYFNPQAQSRLGFSAERFFNISEKGLNRIHEIIQQLSQLQDPQESCRLAHSGKGIALQIGADRVAQCLALIEQNPAHYQSTQLIELDSEVQLTHRAIIEHQQKQLA